MEAKYVLTRDGVLIAVSDNTVYLQKIIDAFTGSGEEFNILVPRLNYAPASIHIEDYFPLPT